MNSFSQLDLFGSDSFPSEREEATKQLQESRSGTFTDNMRLPIHRWFRYSAGFSSDWVEQLIKDFPSNRRPVVLDPFAGSGTTLLTAEKAGAVVYGYESHPFVYRIAAAKLLWHLDERSFLNAATVLLDRAKARKLQVPDQLPDLLVKCFTPETIERLVALRDCYVETRQEADEWKLVWLAITAILRSCSHVGTAQWQYVLPNKRKATFLDPFHAFEAKVSEMISDMDFAKRAGFNQTAKMFLRDAREPAPIEDNSVDLVITSPPYPNNYDYADATRLEMTFWGEISSWGDLQHTVRQFIIRSCSQHTAAERLNLEDLLADLALAPIRSELTDVCHQLAKIRLTKGGKKTYHTMIAAYFADMAKVFMRLRPVCKTGAQLCFVVGDSAPYGIYVPADVWLGRLAVATGFDSFSFEKVRDRNVKWKNRKHRVPLHEGRLWIRG
jgi:hypothetical protein